MKKTLVLAAALGLLGTFSAAQAGQFKNVQTNSVGNNACVTVHSSPQNQGNSGGASMEIEVFEFTPPAQDSYRCCIGSNVTNRALNVRMISLTGAISSSAATAVNAGACTNYIPLNAGFAYQCTVATGPNSAVSANARYTLQICRQ